MKPEGFENPTLVELARQIIDAAKADMHVALPGVIVSYDEDTHLANVQPLLMHRPVIDAPLPTVLPIIPRVPVKHPRTAKAAFILPVTVGDPVTLLFADRSISDWKNGTLLPVEPKLARSHELMDCWAILGGWPESIPFVNPYKGAAAVVTVPGVKVAFGNGLVELLDMFDQLLSYIETQITFSNGGGPTGPPVNFASITALRTKLATLKV